MKKKVIVFLSIIILVFIIITCIIFIKNKTKNDKSQNNETEDTKNIVLPVEYGNESENQLENNVEEKEIENKISNMAESQGFTANENIYELAEEYDGRETLVVKTSIQYKVALAGMIKKDIPNFSEIDSLLKEAPNHTGIWIEEKSREEFLNILKNISNDNYEIDENGFLIKKRSLNSNNYDKIINEMISDGGLYVFDINSITYLVDSVTGEIKKYPFEEMDPHQEYEYFESENKYMFIISQNNEGKINKTEALKKILENK